jgi:hypothetical protein
MDGGSEQLVSFDLRGILNQKKVGRTFAYSRPQELKSPESLLA